jgi:hypothetical protein
MNPEAPTHEAVTQRAQQIWQERGRPSGCDDEIWFEAERQLGKTTAAHNTPSNPEGRGNGNMQGGSSPADPNVAPPTHERAANPPGHPTPAETAAISAQQKKAARTPRQPPRAVPKPKPPETGKPLWDKPHSA